MASAHAKTTRAGEITRTLVMGLWLPAIFLAGLLFSFLLAFHHPTPHHIKVAVAAPPAATAQLQHQLDTAIPGGFTLRPVGSAAEARAAVLGNDAVAAFAPAAQHPQLYGAKADGAVMESIIRQVFTAAAQKAGTTVDFHELVPTRRADALGTSPFYLLMACTLPAYFLVVTMQRAVGFNRRAHVATVVGGGAVAALTCYLTGAYAMNVIPQHPLALLYLFLLTQTVSLTSYGLVSFLGPFFPGAAVTLFIMLSAPSSGVAVPVDLLPGFFRFLHPILPLGNAADALRDVGYFDDQQLGRPTGVLCAWIAAGTALIVLGYLKRLRQLVREAQTGIMGYVSAPPAEDPTVELPEPVALPPHRHHFGEQPPMLTGRASGPAGEPLPGVTITVTDPHGHQLLHTRTDQNGEYAATGFHEGFAIVLASDPGRQPVATRLLLTTAAPVNQDFVLTPRQRAVGGHTSGQSATTITHDQEVAAPAQPLGRRRAMFVAGVLTLVAVVGGLAAYGALADTPRRSSPPAAPSASWPVTAPATPAPPSAAPASAPASAPTSVPTATTPTPTQAAAEPAPSPCDRYLVIARSMALRTQDNVRTGQTINHGDIVMVTRRGTPTGNTRLWYVITQHAQGWVHPDHRYWSPMC
jgi:Protein of unknown function (DUF3533)/Carboxypeptidase regulatory-like domain